MMVYEDDGNSSRQCEKACFNIGDVESLGSAITFLVTYSMAFRRYIKLPVDTSLQNN